MLTVLCFIATIQQSTAGETPLSIVEAATDGVTIDGYVDVSFIARLGEGEHAGSTAAFPNTYRSPGRLYDVPARQDGFNLNVVSVTVDRPLNDANWAAGYHVQLLAGPDARLRNTYSLAGGPFDLAINEAYVSLRAPLGNGLVMRLGHFNSPLGYEVYDSPLNPNYSRSYGYYIEPKSHTGVTFEYPITEWLSAMVGVANSYSPFMDARPLDDWDETYLAVITVTGAGFGWPGASLKLGYTGGHTATSAPSDDTVRIHNFYAGAKIPLPLDGLTLGLAYDYQENYAAGVPAVFFFPAGPDHTEAHAAAIYLNYAVKRWQLNTRVDYATGDPGFTILQNLDPFGAERPMFGPDNDEFLSVTATAGYSLWDNVLSRLEFRWDRDLAGGVPAFGSAAEPRQNSFTVAVNVVYSF